MPHSRKVSNSALGVLQQVGAGSLFGLGKEGCGMLQNQAVQRALLWAMAVVVDRGAIRRPLGLLHLGLHATIPKW